MKKMLTFVVLLVSLLATSQNKTSFKLSRPKLVVGIVVDQMRWDFLYRYQNRYQNNGGFKRLLSGGFSCENTLIPYTPTITCCGHTCIFTGSVPAIHGMTGNNWWDKTLNRVMYCTDDATAKTVGSNTKAGEMSPRNMLVTSVCDELKLATNFRSKVIGIALKDRGGILPAGHAADAAYWYDSKTGDWISSTYYMNDLPQWVKDFNAKKMVDKYYDQGWNTLYPSNSYTQSTADEQEYESKPFGDEQKKFPYDLKSFAGKNYSKIATTPYGNTLTADLAKAAIDAENLGADSITDFLTVSFSSTDYIGHSFGPNSIEIEDTYLRLDKDLGAFLDYLDKKVGKENYLLFLTSDHGVAHVPAFMKENRFPAGIIYESELMKELNKEIRERTGHDSIISAVMNYQVTLNQPLIDSFKMSRDAVIRFVISYLEKKEGIARVFELNDIVATSLNSKEKEMLINGYYPKRCGDVQFILQPQWIDGYGKTGTTHGLWNPYDAHIPLLWYGWGIKNGGKTNRETYMTDIAATLSAILHIQMPSGCVGKPIEEVMK
jgi:predicted AlkP superfamily pyrophosphatase or phosphodiesterase